MITYSYGSLPDEQFEKYKTILHKKVFWLLVYKDPKTADKYTHVDFNQYMERLMEHLNAMNQLLFYPDKMIMLIATLQEAWSDTQAAQFDYVKYRRKILEAHSLIDQLGSKG